MPAYKVSEAAFNDLIDIGAYTEQEWGISQRDNYLNDIEARFETLASNTEHPTVKDRSELRKGCLSSSINEHIIIFRKTMRHQQSDSTNVLRRSIELTSKTGR